MQIYKLGSCRRFSGQKANAAEGQPPSTAFVRGFPRCLITAWRRNERFSSATLPLLASKIEERRVGQSQLPIRHLTMVKMQPLRVASGSFPAHAPAPKSKAHPQVGRRPQMPGRRVALARVSGTSPGDRLSPVTGSAGSAAIIRRAQELSRFAEPTFRQIVAPRNTKTPPPCAETVDVASSLWKPEENLRQIAGVTLRERRGNPAAEILSACEGSLRHLPSQFFQSLAAVRASGDSIMWSGHSCPLPLTLFRPESADHSAQPPTDPRHPSEPAGTRLQDNAAHTFPRSASAP